MDLTEKHFDAIELIVEGRTMVDVAKIVGIGRRTLYRWMEDGNFKAELHKRKQVLETEANEKICSRLDMYVEEMHKLAMTSKSDKVKQDALTYLMDRVLGRPTSKISNIEGNSDNSGTDIIDIDFVLKEIDDTAEMIE